MPLAESFLVGALLVALNQTGIAAAAGRMRELGKRGQE
jgi:hypothetical protein